MKKILLGSHSPRRIELLRDMGIKFRLVDIDYNEFAPPSLKAGQITAYLAKQKALHYTRLDQGEILITADTIVWIKENGNKSVGCKLGKPRNLLQAKEMLTCLSNRTHAVYTSVALSYFNGQTHKIEVFTDKSYVTFNRLSAEMIEFYVSHFSVLDKAGAYAIQDWIGWVGIRKINGSFYNVMGLPTDLLYDKLKMLKGF